MSGLYPALALPTSDITSPVSTKTAVKSNSYSGVQYRSLRSAFQSSSERTCARDVLSFPLIQLQLCAKRMQCSSQLGRRRAAGMVTLIFPTFTQLFGKLLPCCRDRRLSLRSQQFPSALATK